MNGGEILYTNAKRKNTTLEQCSASIIVNIIVAKFT